MSLILSQQALQQVGGTNWRAVVRRGRDLPVVKALSSPTLGGLGYERRCMSSKQNGSSGSRLQVSASKDDIRIVAPNVDLDSLPDYLKKECLLFYYPDQEPLARKIAAASSSIQLSEVKWA